LIHRIGISDVEQERSRHRLSFTELDRAVANPQPRVTQLAALVAPHLLNRAERALLLYGTLARYQRDLRSILVEFKVNNAPEAYAAIADVAGVKASEVGEALRAGSRLERIGMVENLISEHNITDLADLMKVSEKLPPVLMREYRDQNELMAVFTRPSAKSELGVADFAFVADDVRVRANRLALLSALQRLFLHMANLSRLPG